MALEDSPQLYSESVPCAPVDSDFPSALSTAEIHALLQPFEAAGQMLRFVGTKVRLLSSLQPLEAGPELESAITRGLIKNPVFSYTDRSHDIARFRTLLEPFLDFNLTGTQSVTGSILSTWLVEKVKERLIEIDILESRGNLIPGEGSAVLELSKKLYGVPSVDLITYCEKQLQVTDAKPAEAMDPTRGFSPEEVQRLIEARYLTPWFNGSNLPAWSVRVNQNSSVSRCFNSPEEKTFYIGNRIYSPQYVEQLMRHEMLHVYRAVIGLQQPGTLLQELLSCGLAGYEATEEGLAIISESSANPAREFRKQTLFARVVTADSALKMLSFAEAYDRLRDLKLSPSNAYNVVLGTYRGGGYLKDALYLQGAVAINTLLESGEDMTPLFAGKTSIRHIPETQLLIRAGVIQLPAVIPDDFKFFFRID